MPPDRQTTRRRRPHPARRTRIGVGIMSASITLGLTGLMAALGGGTSSAAVGLVHSAGVTEADHLVASTTSATSTSSTSTSSTATSSTSGSAGALTTTTTAARAAVPSSSVASSSDSSSQGS